MIDDEILHNDIKFPAVGKRITGSLQQVFRLLQIKLQSNTECEDRALSRLISPRTLRPCNGSPGATGLSSPSTV